jgi:FlaA1/EpsC-like NDP-sugar epimerase
LDVGEPVKISDLAEKMIKLSDLEVIDNDGHGDIKITYAGLKSGEKLYEELLIGDNIGGTEHPRAKV